MDLKNVFLSAGHGVGLAGQPTANKATVQNQMTQQGQGQIVVGPGGQPVIANHVAGPYNNPAQQALLMQQIQLQQNKKLRGRDQVTAALLQQQAAVAALQQSKVSPTPLRKDFLGGVGAAIQQQLAGQRFGRNIPTAALLQQSTIGTSDKSKGFLHGDGTLTSLHRYEPVSYSKSQALYFIKILTHFECLLTFSI